MDRYFLFSILKQMRSPIITMIIYYTVSIVGLLLIPGVDNEGNEYYMGIFHSVYIVVYTSTTIGFGEIPYEWTDNQRLWIILISISGVVSWVYAMGKLIALSQNQVFKEKLDLYRFEGLVKRNKKPFYIMCGFGITGKTILDLMNNHDINIVIIDQDEKSFSSMEAITYRKRVPYIKGDCSHIEILKIAGLHMNNCKGIIIVTGNEEVNVRTAISCKLLDPDKKIFARAYEKENIRNLHSFGTEHIISEASLFAKEISLLVDNIDEHNLRKKLDSEIKKFTYTSSIPKGKWVICGLNPTTAKVATFLINNNIDFSILTNKESQNKLINSYCIKGEGINYEDLLSAGIKDASVVFAANYKDFKNLSTLITAKEINNDIYTISIQNKSYRDDLFNKIKIDLVLQPQHKIAAKVHSLISEPFLNIFYNKIGELEKDDIQRIEFKLNQDDLHTWHFRMNNEKSFYKKLKDRKILLKHILPVGHQISALMVYKENGDTIIEPKKSYVIEKNDVILFAGNNDSFYRQRLMMYNENVYKEYQLRRNKNQG